MTMLGPVVPPNASTNPYATPYAPLYGAEFVARPSARRKREPWGAAEWFMLSQTAIPALLFLPGAQPARLLIRVAAFATSLLLLLPWRGSRNALKRHPSRIWLAPTMLYLTLMIFHPTTNSLLAGVAQVALYVSVFAPAYWMPKFVRSASQLDRLITILWVCSTVNAAVGVMQVYDPDRWMPREFSAMAVSSMYQLDAARYDGPNGRRITRPPGLFDTPGAVAGPAMFAALIGLVMFARRGAMWRKLLGLVSSGIGLTAIYLAQVRTSFLIVLGMLLVYALISAAFDQRRVRTLSLLVGTGVVLAGSLAASLLLGGQATIDRLNTLVAGDPVSVYYNAGRGSQLDYAVQTLAPKYPFGAGLGRWGMMRAYFGNASNPNSPQIWAELQLPAWILDGGLVLVALYVLALIATLSQQFRVARRSTDPLLGESARTILALSAGTLALIFGFTPFTTQIGIQFWVLAGALHGAVDRQ
jgi:hypothetical protein